MILSEPFECTEIQDHTCPVCGRNFIPAPYHQFRVYGRRVCTWSCKLRGEREGFAKNPESLKNKPIAMFDRNGNHIRDFQNAREIELELHISVDCVRKCCRKETARAGGFVFRYIKETYKKEEGKNDL